MCKLLNLFLFSTFFTLIYGGTFAQSTECQKAKFFGDAEICTHPSLTELTDDLSRAELELNEQYGPAYIAEMSEYFSEVVQDCEPVNLAILTVQDINCAKNVLLFILGIAEDQGYESIRQGNVAVPDINQPITASRDGSPDGIIESALSILGVNITQNLNTNVNILTERGYICELEFPQFGFHDAECKKKFGENTGIVNLAGFEFVGDERWVNFSCLTYNGCGKNLAELQQEIYQSFDITVQETSDLRGIKYCATSTDGTYLCLQDIFGANNYTITLSWPPKPETIDER